MTHSNPCQDAALLPMERALCLVQHNNPHSLPEPHTQFDRYLSLKHWLRDNVFQHIGSGGAANTEGSPFLTDHGPAHFDRVIKYAGKLAGVDDRNDGNSQSTKLSGYELFLTLSAILLHDAGNAYGRAGHAKRPLQILADMGAMFSQDMIEKRLIAGIAEVHGGLARDNSQDTIGGKQWPDTKCFQDSIYRPNLVAALVRFADEICEDRSRTSPFLVTTGAINGASLSHHLYAKAITSVTVDTKDKSICIEYDIEASDLVLSSRVSDKPKTLVDVIIGRLEKMHLERKYCLKYMAEVAPIIRIRATISIHHEDMEPRKTVIVVEDSGYPNTDYSLREVFLRHNPGWDTPDLISAYGDQSYGN